MYNTDVQLYISLTEIIARLDNIRTIYHVYNAQPFGETYSAFDRKTQIVQKSATHTTHHLSDHINLSHDPHSITLFT